MAAEPSQQGGDSRPGSSGKDPERTRSSGAKRKSTGSARSGRGQSPAPRTSDRSRTPDRARIPIRHQTPDREVTRDKGKTHALSTTPCRSRSPLRPLGPPLPGNRGFPRVDDTRGSQPENLPPLVRVSGRVPFPERQVPGRRERRRQVTQRMRLLLLQT
jgi:hypothetical protein